MPPSKNQTVITADMVNAAKRKREEETAALPAPAPAESDKGESQQAQTSDVALLEGFDSLPLKDQVAKIKAMVGDAYDRQAKEWRYKLYPLKKAVEIFARKFTEFDAFYQALTQGEDRTRIEIPSLRRLRDKLEEIDALDISDEEKRKAKIQAAVDGIDPIDFHESLSRGLSEGQDGARRLYAQLSGMLDERKVEMTAPVFNITIQRAQEEKPAKKVIDIPPVRTVLKIENRH